MRSFTYQEFIERPPAEVFAVMLDFSRASRWRSLVRKMELVGGGPVCKDSQVVVTVDVMGKVQQTVSDIWSFDPPRRIGFRNTANGFTGLFEYILHPEGEGTRVTFTADLRPHGLAWLLLPLVLHSHRARYRDQLQRLKGEVERKIS